MANRNFSSPADTSRKTFTDDEIQKVWDKLESVEGEDSTMYKKDYAGAWIKRDEYGNTGSSLGWEIDHRKPVAKGGTDDVWNLDALQWNNNRTKSDDYPTWNTSKKAGVSMTGLHYNIDKKQGWEIKQ